MSEIGNPPVEYTEADKANACRVFNAYRRSNLPCEGAAIIAELRIAAFEAGHATALLTARKTGEGK